MELHKALKEIVASRGADMINNIQIINYLLDYQAFKDKPATKLILRDVINAGYGELIFALQNDKSWQIKLKQYQHEFIDSCGYKEDLAVYVFESLAYAIGLNVDGGQEPEINSGFNVDSFFDILEVETQQSVITPQSTQKQNANPADLFTIAQSFYNEGKYQQAKSFAEKAINSQPGSTVPADYLKLLGDILLRIGYYDEALKSYNECFNQKSKELKCTIEQLRRWLEQHKVRTYENIVFNYYFCLYAVKRMGDTNWLQLVKREAKDGVIDAIKYCAENGINPIEDHIDIYFTDRNLLKHHDILYADGSFAHEESKSKDKIGIVYLTDTSDYEKSQGWTHGYIVGDVHSNIFFNNNYCQWSILNEDLPFPHTHYTEDDLRHWDELKTIESEHFIKFNRYRGYPAFNAVHNIFPRIPLKGTSGWFLPSIHTCKRLRGLISSWTSTQADRDHAIYCNSYIFKLMKKSDNCWVVPVAAF